MGYVNKSFRNFFFSSNNDYWKQYDGCRSGYLNLTPNLFDVIKKRDSLSQSVMLDSYRTSSNSNSTTYFRLKVETNSASEVERKLNDRLYVWGCADKKEPSDEYSDALFNAFTAFLRENNIDGTDCVGISPDFNFEAARESARLVDIAPKNEGAFGTGRFIYSSLLRYGLNHISHIGNKKRKVSMQAKRDLTEAVIEALCRRTFDLKDEAVKSLLEKLVTVVSIAMVHEYVVKAYVARSSEQNATLLLSLWIACLLKRKVGIKQQVLLSDAIELLGDNVTTMALTVNSHGENVLVGWLSEAVSDHFKHLQLLLSKLTISPEQIASQIFVLSRKYAYSYALRLLFVSHGRFGSEGDHLAQASRALKSYCDNAHVLPVENEHHRNEGLAFLSVVDNVCEFDCVETVEAFNADLWVSDGLIGKGFLNRTIKYSALEVSRYLRREGVSIVTIRDKGWVSYPTLKAVYNRPVLVKMILEAHEDEEGLIDTGLLNDTFKNSSTSMAIYVADVMAHIDTDAFLEKVTTERILKWFLEAKGLQGVDVIGKVKNEPLRKRVMRDMFS